eukprot:TRINITY_DN1170_c5_g1_i1.p1 TRINITY_DN1170_c5_g1~~TRINITY_DN1170_c5_g1_i1.p1  ORF type:complete len:1038 (+),score=447.44 TRINITY_DN1170_c5_g1_i1:123-3236(+)
MNEVKLVLNQKVAPSEVVGWISGGEVPKDLAASGVKLPLFAKVFCQTLRTHIGHQLQNNDRAGTLDLQFPSLGQSADRGQKSMDIPNSLTHRPYLENIASIQAAIILHRCVPIATEVLFLAKILSIELSPSLLQMKVASKDVPPPLSSPINCIFYACWAWQSISPMLTFHFPSEDLAFLASQIYLRTWTPKFVASLTEMQTVKESESKALNSQVPTENEIPDEFNLKTEKYHQNGQMKSYHNRQKMADAFLNLIREFKLKTTSLQQGMGNQQNLDVSLTQVQTIVGTLLPTNYTWFAQFFVDMMCRHMAPSVDIEISSESPGNLRSQMERIRQLEERIYPALEMELSFSRQFFVRFIEVANNFVLTVQLVEALKKKLLLLSLTNPTSSTSDEISRWFKLKSLSRCIAALGLAPYQSSYAEEKIARQPNGEKSKTSTFNLNPTELPRDLADSNSLGISLVPILQHLLSTWKSSNSTWKNLTQMTATIPWILDHMTYISQPLPSWNLPFWFEQAVSILLEIYANFPVPRDPTFSSRNLFLASELELFFESRNIDPMGTNFNLKPNEEENFNLKMEVQLEAMIRDRRFVENFWEFQRKLRGILRTASRVVFPTGKPAVKSSTSNVPRVPTSNQNVKPRRKLTPIKVEEKIEETDFNLKFKLKKWFLKQHPVLEATVNYLSEYLGPRLVELALRRSSDFIRQSASSLHVVEKDLEDVPTFKLNSAKVIVQDAMKKIQVEIKLRIQEAVDLNLKIVLENETGELLEKMRQVAFEEIQLEINLKIQQRLLEESENSVQLRIKAVKLKFQKISVSAQIENLEKLQLEDQVENSTRSSLEQFCKAMSAHNSDDEILEMADREFRRNFDETSDSHALFHLAQLLSQIPVELVNAIFNLIPEISQDRFLKISEIDEISRNSIGKSVLEKWWKRTKSILEKAPDEYLWENFLSQAFSRQILKRSKFPRLYLGIFIEISVDAVRSRVPTTFLEDLFIEISKEEYLENFRQDFFKMCLEIVENSKNMVTPVEWTTLKHYLQSRGIKSSSL